MTAPRKLGEPEARAAYLGMGAGDRSLRRLFIILQQTMGDAATVPSARTLATWSKKYDWPKVAETHDEAIATAAANEIAEQRGQEAAALGLDKNYVLANLKEVLERCMQRAPVMVRRGKFMVQATDEEGRHVWQFNSLGAAQVLKLIGLEFGMYRGRSAGSAEGEGDADKPSDVTIFQDITNIFVSQATPGAQPMHDVTPAAPRDNGPKIIEASPVSVSIDINDIFGG